MKNYIRCPEQLNKLLDYGSLMVEATLDDCTTVNLVNETPVSSKQFYAAVVLVRKDGKELEVLGKTTPLEKAEKFFWKYLDDLKAKGNQVVVTYCSYD